MTVPLTPATAMRGIDTARKHHDRTCRYGGVAIEAHVNPSDLLTLGWNEGEDICGLRVVADGKLNQGRVRVYCDAELHGFGYDEEQERVSAVSTHTVPASA